MPIALRHEARSLAVVAAGALTIGWLMVTGLWLMKGRASRVLLNGCVALALGMAGWLVWNLSGNMWRWSGRSFGLSIFLLRLMTVGEIVGALAALWILRRLVLVPLRRPLFWLCGLLLGRHIVFVLAVASHIGALAYMLKLDTVLWFSVWIKLSELAVPVLLLLSLPACFMGVRTAMWLLRFTAVAAVLPVLMWSFLQIPLVSVQDYGRIALMVGLVFFGVLEAMTLWFVAKWAFFVSPSR